MGVRTWRLVQAVRIQFHRRTIDLNRFARLKPTALCSPVVKSMFEDFLDLSSCNPLACRQSNPALGFSTPSFPAPGDFLTGAAVWEA